MISTISAFAPANISCVFKIHTDVDPRMMGSTGFGFTINDGVTVQVSKSKQNSILFNNEPLDFPTVATTVKHLTNESVAVRLRSSLPLGTGFGLSGASALATAYALNKLLHLQKTKKKLAIIAHTADVVNKTGLGDVTNQYFGGFLIKTQPSSQFIVEKLSFARTPVYCKFFGKLQTKSVLNNPSITKTINKAADAALDKLKTLMKQEHPFSLAEILHLSKEFAVTSGLLTDPKTQKAIETIEDHGGSASMIMLGNAVMSDISFEGATKYMISDVAAHLL